jgi:hypothetical protein
MIAILLFSALIGCRPSSEQLAAVSYAPLPGEDWHTAAPSEVDLDAELVAELYYNASQLGTLWITRRQRWLPDR